MYIVLMNSVRRSDNLLVWDRDCDCAPLLALCVENIKRTCLRQFRTNEKENVCGDFMITN
jgi:hypothetical protein